MKTIFFALLPLVWLILGIIVSFQLSALNNLILIGILFLAMLSLKITPESKRQSFYSDYFPGAALAILSVIFSFWRGIDLYHLCLFIFSSSKPPFIIKATVAILSIISGAILMSTLLSLQTWLEKKLKLQKPKVKKVPETLGLSAWNNTGGYTDRFVNYFPEGEIAMGGPIYGSYIIDKKYYLTGLGSSYIFSSDKRYFAAPIPSRDTWGFCLLDLTENCLYFSKLGIFWELDSIDRGFIYGRYSPLTQNAPQEIVIEEFKRSSEKINFKEIDGLFITEDFHNELLQKSKIIYSPTQKHKLEAKLKFNAQDILNSDEPGRLIHSLESELYLDDIPLNQSFPHHEKIFWAPDESSLILDLSWGRFLHCDCETKKSIQYKSKVTSKQELSYKIDSEFLSFIHVQAFDGEKVYLEGTANMASLDEPRGTVDIPRYFHWSPFKIDNDLKIHPLDLPANVIVEEYSLLQESNGTFTTYSQLGKNHSLTLTCSHTDHWPLFNATFEGMKLERLRAKHLWSHDQEKLALIKSDEKNELLESLIILNFAKKSITQIDQQFINIGLMSFEGDYLLINHAVGFSTREEKKFDALSYNPIPRDMKYQDFLNQLENQSTYSEGLFIDLKNEKPIIKDVILSTNEPTSSLAALNFIYKSVFCYGAMTEYLDDDNFSRAESHRENATLIFKNGICLFRTGTAMIWDDSGRYLFGAYTWQDKNKWETISTPYLLDIEEKCIYTNPEITLGHIPLFKKFSEDEVRYEGFEATFWRPNEISSSLMHLKLDQIKTPQNREFLIEKQGHFIRKKDSEAFDHFHQRGLLDKCKKRLNL